ncbi:hypothetical protein [Cellvibrio sp. QJXJ]|uniref:hypothetical protein n=1 Tax=Cellvibrio sp. QJXJ TaxID=2964606 RepID=UPI0021C49D54|nr:hypothetical protein [Cellvibrio sp. QJXJ]UUA75274.1 hypothetical protein NNX04_22725 [Cellvibrio sp. QJXJ]
MAFSINELATIPNTLSQPRFATYLRSCANDPQKALALYQWNLQLSAALIIPLHVLEIGIRNAVVERLDTVYQSNWHLNQGFIRSLPDHGLYKPRSDLLNVAKVQPTAGKVVAELKFIFWEKMFNKRHHGIFWKNHIHRVFPHAPNTLNEHQLRERIHDDIFEIRKLRNRIAHHEPIFPRQLGTDYTRIFELISWRDANAAQWVKRIQNVTLLLTQRP